MGPGSLVWKPRAGPLPGPQCPGLGLGRGPRPQIVFCLFLGTLGGSDLASPRNLLLGEPIDN